MGKINSKEGDFVAAASSLLSDCFYAWNKPDVLIQYELCFYALVIDQKDSFM